MWGLPRHIRYDNGPGFNSHGLRVELERLGVRIDSIPPNHPESNGKVERMNKVVKSTLRRLLAACSKAGTDWHDVLFHSKFSINSSPSKSNGGFTAWQIQVGWIPQLPSESSVESSSSEQSEEDWILSQAANRLQAKRERRVEMAFKQAELLEANSMPKSTATYLLGQSVWVTRADPVTLAKEMVSNGHLDRPSQRRWEPGVIVGLFGSEGNSKSYRVQCVGERSRRKMVLATTEQLKKRVNFPDVEVSVVIPSSSISKGISSKFSYRDAVVAGIGTLDKEVCAPTAENCLLRNIAVVK